MRYKKESFMMLLAKQIHNIVKTVIVIGTTFLIGCSSIEYRSDAAKRTPLQALTDTSVVAKKVWRTSAGKGVGRANVKLLLANDGDVLFAADANGLVVAIDRLTGKKLWQQHLKMAISSGPAIGNKKVVVGGNAFVAALNSETGEILWKTTVTSEVLAAPKIKEDTVLVSTLDGGLVALSGTDGHQLWRFTLSPPSLVLRRSSVPDITKHHIVAGFANGKLVVINKLDGSVDWSADVSVPQGRSDIQRMIDISADPVIKDEVIYVVNYQGNLKAFALYTGQVIWERTVSSYSGMFVDNKNVYVAATNGDVLAFDRHTGGSVWTQNALHGRGLSTPVVQGKFVVVGDDEGYLHWLDKKQGELKGRYKFMGKDGIEAAPVVYADSLYIYGRNGQVGAISVGSN